MNFVNCFLLYALAMLILPWLFLREPCDYPLSKIRKVLFAVLLCAAQLVMVLGVVEGAAFTVNHHARGRLQGYVSEVQKVLGEENLSADEVCSKLVEKYYREADPAEWRALKKPVVVQSCLVIAGLILLAGVLFAAVRFKLRTLLFLLLFYGCAAGGFMASRYLSDSVTELMDYGFQRTAFREVNLAVMAKVLKTEDRLALRLAMEDVKDARVWDKEDFEDFGTCLAMCQDFVSVLYESLRKREAGKEAPASR